MKRKEQLYGCSFSLSGFAVQDGETLSGRQKAFVNAVANRVHIRKAFCEAYEQEMQWFSLVCKGVPLRADKRRAGTRPTLLFFNV